MHDSAPRGYANIFYLLGNFINSDTPPASLQFALQIHSVLINKRNGTMANCICLVQEGQIPQTTLEQLGDGIRDIVVSNSLGDDVNIAWIVIPKGKGWTAGKPSTSSVLTIAGPDIPQDHRVQALSSLCDMWSQTTGCHINEIVASVIPAE